LPLWQKADPVYPSAPHWLFVLQVIFAQLPFEHVCPLEQVCFNLAAELFEHFAEAVPGFEQVYVM
jgi:hypothetical protein